MAFDAQARSLRRFAESARTLHLAAHLNAGQRAFQMATQLAFLE
ncbi:ImmA/IrrE family metallo-endopeptidase [Celeribacter sp. ULVN23_4]